MNTPDIPVGPDSAVRLIVSASIHKLAGDNESRVGTLLLDSALWFPDEGAREIKHSVFDMEADRRERADLRIHRPRVHLEYSLREDNRFVRRNLASTFRIVRRIANQGLR